MADLRRCRAGFLLPLLLVQLVAASTEQVKSKKLVTYVSVPDDGEVRETIEFRNISEACDASLQREREREILTVQLRKETRNDDP